MNAKQLLQAYALLGVVNGLGKHADRVTVWRTLEELQGGKGHLFRGRVSLPTLYDLLAYLEDQGLVTSWDGELQSARWQTKRRYYALTVAGQQVLQRGSWN